jgi:hypothetical protein
MTDTSEPRQVCRIILEDLDLLMLVEIVMPARTYLNDQ